MTIPGLRVAPGAIALGTGEFGTRRQGEEAFAILDAFVEHGGNFIDTARNYGDWVPDAPRGAAELTIGKWLAQRGRHDDLVIATKGCYPLLDGKNLPRMTAADIVGDIEKSLAALGVEAIDLWWLHTDDPSTPVEAILPVLEGQVRAGKIRAYAASNWSVPRLESAKAFAAEHQLQGFWGDQILWNAAVLQKFPYGDASVGFMSPERFAFHRSSGMPVVAFQSQAFGLFSRMESGTLEQMNPGFRGFYEPGEATRRFEVIRGIASERQLNANQVALAYLLSQEIPCFPIIGCQSPAQVVDSLGAMDIRLSEAEVAAIDLGQKGSRVAGSS